jgi:pantoate--beta-alanine ligase
LFLLKDNFNTSDIAALQEQAADIIQAEEGVELEYLEIADGETLHPANQNTKTFVALVAARVGKTRLIDNAIL